ncbi:hypothetical protein JXA02_03910, partial [candidate division KSB1 bacterium]|nr:hypothetical protein [candidate division KSB1 bacterium]
MSRAYEEISFDLQLDRADSFQIFIMPTRKSFRESLQGRLPSWTGAFANPSVNMMVIKSPRWSPDDSFAATLVHEFFHLLIHQHVGARELPRWLDEGLAIFYSREERWKKATTLSKALTTGSLIPLSEIDFVLEYHQAKADLAYQQSLSAVEYLLRTYDSDGLRQIIGGIKGGQNLDSCFRSATGSSYAEFEMEWQNYVRQTAKWMWLYELDDYLWLFIFVLLVLAFVLRRRHNIKIEEQWRAQSEETPRTDEEEEDEQEE